MIRILELVAALVCAVPAIAQPLPANLDKANAMVIDTTKGRIVVKLRTDLAPQHAERIKLLAREVGASSVTYRSGNLTVTGVTAGSAAPALIRRATEGTVTTKTGRTSVRAPELDPLTLAEESLRALLRSG